MGCCPENSSNDLLNSKAPFKQDEMESKFPENSKQKKETNDKRDTEPIKQLIA